MTPTMKRKTRVGQRFPAHRIDKVMEALVKEQVGDHLKKKQLCEFTKSHLHHPICNAKVTQKELLCAFPMTDVTVMRLREITYGMDRPRQTLWIIRVVDI